MWLKELRLKNFQKHESLVLNFTPGVNILYGHSDAGKSCIRRAIGFVFFNEPRTDDIIRKEGSKQTSVCAVLDDDTEVERVKSSSINRYVVRHLGRKDLVYDSIGSEIPEEVQQVLKVKIVEIDKLSLNLNISEQVCLPFLTGADFPASARLKLFNKLTGNDLLDVVVQNFNKEIIGIRRSLTVEENVVKDNQPKIEALDKIIAWKKETAKTAADKLKSIADNYSRLEELKRIRRDIHGNRILLKAVEYDLSSFPVVDEVKIASLKVQATSLGSLSALKEALHLCLNKLYMTKKELSTMKVPVLDAVVLGARVDRLAKIKQVASALAVNKEAIKATTTLLAQVKQVDFDVDSRKALVEKIRSLKIISAGLKDVGTKIKASFGEWNTLQGLIPTQEKEYKDILKEAGVCPTCKAKITEEHIAHVNL